MFFFFILATSAAPTGRSRPFASSEELDPPPLAVQEGGAASSHVSPCHCVVAEPPHTCGGSATTAAKRSLEPPMRWVGNSHGDPLARSMTGPFLAWRGPGGSAGRKVASNLLGVCRRRWIGLDQRKTFDHPMGWSAFASDGVSRYTPLMLYTKLCLFALFFGRCCGPLLSVFTTIMRVVFHAKRPISAPCFTQYARPVSRTKREGRPRE